MKRSEIEKHIEWALAFLEKRSFHMPEFAYWKLDDWKKNIDRIETIQQTMLGWDITDYGHGDFLQVGSILFTIRNGLLDKPNVGTPYAEKVIPLYEGQSLPMHFHFSKTEDIINRGGGKMFMRLYNATDDNQLDETGDVTIYMDGMARTFAAGEEFLVSSGNSVSLTPRVYHSFGAKDGYGDVLVGEVSSINDDTKDNNFYEKTDRFSRIKEDVQQQYILCNEYTRVLR